MTRRTKHELRAARNPGIDPASDWTTSDHYVAPNGRHLSPGTEVSIHGERGKFRFQRRVVTDNGVEWLDFIGGTKGVNMWRSFRPERIKRVHVKRTTITATEARSLLKEKRAEKRRAS